MTYDVLYADYLKTTDNPYGYTQFKAIIREYEKNHDYKYHNIYEPGREMQFDFAGDNLLIVDKATGEAIQAIVYIMTNLSTIMSNKRMYQALTICQF